MIVGTKFNVKDVVWFINGKEEPESAIVNTIKVVMIDVSGLPDTTAPTMTFIDYSISLYGGKGHEVKERELFASEGEALTNLALKYEELAEQHRDKQQQYYLDQANKTRQGG